MSTFGLFIAVCRDCGTQYRVPVALPDAPEMVMHSASLRYHASVDVERDAGYRALWALANSDSHLVALMDVQRVRATRIAFGKMCTPSPDGTAYTFYFPSKCPQCRSSRFDFGPSKPPETINVVLPTIQHPKLDTAGQSIRLEYLHSAMAQIKSSGA